MSSKSKLTVFGVDGAHDDRAHAISGRFLFRRSRFGAAIWRILQLAFTSLILSTAFLTSAVAQERVLPLSGISKVTTQVYFISTGDAPVGISKSRLTTILELKLRSAGLRVLTEDEDLKDPDINPYVMLELSTLRTRNQNGTHIGFTYAARISARVFGNVPINRGRAPMELWADDTMGVTSTESAGVEVERVINSLSDSLLNAWLAANPRR